MSFCCAACSSPFSVTNKPWQFLCCHNICNDCQEATIHMAEQEECLLCLKPAFPSALNHGLLALLREREEGMAGEEEEARPHKRVCVVPSAAVPPELLSAWQEHIEHLDAAAAAYKVASADGEKLLLEKHAAVLQDMVVQHAEQLESLRCQGNRDVLQLQALRRPAEKEFELAKESALAHVAHLGLLGSVLPTIPEIPRPCVVVPRPPAARYTVFDCARQYCTVLPGRSHAYFVEGKIIREYDDRQTALRVLFRMYLASSWYVHTARVGSAARIESPFTFLDAMETQVPASRIDACMLPELIARMDEVRICLTGTSKETSGAFVMLPSADGHAAGDQAAFLLEIISLAGKLPPYDASLRPEYVPSDRCFCSTADCRAPVLAIV